MTDDNDSTQENESAAKLVAQEVELRLNARLAEVDKQLTERLAALDKQLVERVATWNGRWSQLKVIAGLLGLTGAAVLSLVGYIQVQYNQLDKRQTVAELRQSHLDSALNRMDDVFAQKTNAAKATIDDYAHRGVLNAYVKRDTLRAYALASDVPRIEHGFFFRSVPAPAPHQASEVRGYVPFRQPFHKRPDISLIVTGVECCAHRWTATLDSVDAKGFHFLLRTWEDALGTALWINYVASGS